MHSFFPPIGQLYVEVFRNYSAGIALVDGELRLSYADLADWVARLIGGFDELGLRPGDALGLALNNGADYIALYVAAQIAGLQTVELAPQLPVDALIIVSGKPLSARSSLRRTTSVTSSRTRCSGCRDESLVSDRAQVSRISRS